MILNIFMVAIADKRLDFWRAFFGAAVVINDTTILEASHLLAKSVSGTCPFSIMHSLYGAKEHKLFWPCDEIHLKYPWFFYYKLISFGAEESYFEGRQEAWIKDSKIWRKR